MAPRKTTAIMEPQEIEKPETPGSYTDTILAEEAKAPILLDHFARLNKINVNDRVEKKKTGNTELSYLSWSFAWQELKMKYPDAVYNIHHFGPNNLPYVYDENTGYMVFTDMTVQGITHTMWLPVMDGANKAMKNKPYQYTTGFGQYKKEKTCDAADMFDINKTIMRCLVKNISMFGLGLYIYAGEDLPNDLNENTCSDIVLDAEKKAQEKLTLDSDKTIKVKKSISEHMVKMTENKTAEEKMTIAREIIEPIIGMVNYNLCNDPAKLDNLLEKLKQKGKEKQ